MTIYQGGLTKVLEVPTDYKRRHGCLAFHPDDPNVFFHFGGFNYYSAIMKSAFAYHIKEEQFADKRDLPGGMCYHSCIGYMTTAGKPAIMIVGGTNGGHKDDVLEYDITSNTYKNLPNFPHPTNKVMLVELGGFMYAFGGRDGDNKWTDTVKKITLAFDKDWEVLDSKLKYADEIRALMPYSF